MRPLPFAPRPFSDEALGSWIGRLAARYRVVVAQLDAEYGLGLVLSGPLAWLLPSPLSSISLSKLSELTRMPGDAISALSVDAAERLPGAPYCSRCVFLNPLEVESPYWKKTWLVPGASICDVHGLPLVVLQASLARRSGNMRHLINGVGQFEVQRRELARLEDIGRRH